MSKVNINSVFVSLIVSVYNAETLIKSHIEALLNQSFSKNQYEIIYVDNGSPGRTVNIIKEYPVKLFVESNVRSPYAVRNNGIKNSIGSIIFI